MIKYLLCFLLVLNSLLAQQETSINAIKKIRLDNLKKNYLDQTIRFYIPGKISVIGELRDITESNFIIRGKNGPLSYSHQNVDYVFIDPTFKDLMMVFAISSVGAISSYMGLLIIKENADSSMKGVITSTGAVLAGILARATFYKPVRIDISGETKT